MAEEVEAAVKITLKDVWVAQQETNKQVAKLVEQLPTHVQQTSEDKVESDKRLDDHETRLRAVERLVWRAIGGGSLLITVATLVIAALAIFIK